MKILYQEGKYVKTEHAEQVVPNPKMVAIYRENALVKTIPSDKVVSISDDEPLPPQYLSMYECEI